MSDENYKGDLQQYCQMRQWVMPFYDTKSAGTPEAPAWIVTLKWGNDQQFTTEPIPGNKRHAEQMATKQVLEAISAEKQAHLADNPRHMATDTPQLQEQVLSYTGINGLLDAVADSSEDTTGSETLTDSPPRAVPVELVVSAIGIANHRYNEKKRDERARSRRSSQTESDEVFASNVAEIAMTLITAIEKAAKQRNITIEGVSTTTTRDDTDGEKDRP